MEKTLSGTKYTKCVTTIIVLFSFLIAPVASHAAFTAFDLGNDGTYELTIADNSGNDLDARTGVIVANYLLGDFSINVTTGVTKPHIGSSVAPSMDLNSIHVTSGAGGGTLRIDFVETGFIYNGMLVGSVGGTTNGSVSFTAGYGGTYPISLGLFSPTAFSGTTSGAFDLSTPDQLVLGALINHTAAGKVTSFDFNVSPVPIPSTMLLLGSGLVGLVGIGRWRIRK